MWGAGKQTWNGPEVAHCLARISEAAVSVMDGNGHRWAADGGAIVVGSTLAHGMYCSSWRGSLLDCYYVLFPCCILAFLWSFQSAE